MIEIIPAIDLIGGKCVRLCQGDFQQQKTYSEDPLTVARSFQAAGLRRLHLVDLDGARAGSPRNLDALSAIANATTLDIDFSGGIRCKADLDRVLNAGAAFAGIGSLAVRDPELLQAWVAHYGPARFLVGADVRDGLIAVDGWTQRTELSLLRFIERMMRVGLLDIFCTDVSVDGMMSGPSLWLYRQVLQHFPGIRLIASGGVRDIDDVQELEAIGCSGVIVGKALYEGGLPLDLITSKIIGS